MNLTAKQQAIRIFKALALLILAYVLVKLAITDTYLYKTIQIAFAHLIAAGLQLLADGFSFDANTGDIIYHTQTLTTANSLALKYYFIVATLLAIAPTNYRKSFLLLVAAFVGLYICNILKYANDVFSPSNLVGFLYWVNVSLRYLIVYVVLKYKIDQHQLTRHYFEKLNQAIGSVFQVSLHRALLIVCIIPAIAAFFDWFLLAKWNVLVDGLSALILGMSKFSLHAMGYTEVFVAGKTINLANYWLYLGTNCLGVGLMVVFSALIVSIKSPLINRLLYIPLGIACLILLNALRINAILLHIFNNQTPQHLIEDYHDLSNNVYYVIVFCIILIYIVWFQNLKIGTPKPRINQ